MADSSDIPARREGRVVLHPDETVQGSSVPIVVLDPPCMSETLYTFAWCAADGRHEESLSCRLLVMLLGGDALRGKSGGFMGLVFALIAQLQEQVRDLNEELKNAAPVDVTDDFI